MSVRFGHVWRVTVLATLLMGAIRTNAPSNQPPRDSDTNATADGIRSPYGDPNTETTGVSQVPEVAIDSYMREHPGLPITSSGMFTFEPGAWATPWLVDQAVLNSGHLSDFRMLQVGTDPVDNLPTYEMQVIFVRDLGNYEPGPSDMTIEALRDDIMEGFRTMSGGPGGGDPNSRLRVTFVEGGEWMRVSELENLPAEQRIPSFLVYAIDERGRHDEDNRLAFIEAVDVNTIFGYSQTISFIVPRLQNRGHPYSTQGTAIHEGQHGLEAGHPQERGVRSTWNSRLVTLMALAWPGGPSSPMPLDVYTYMQLGLIRPTQGQYCAPENNIWSINPSQARMQYVSEAIACGNDTLVIPPGTYNGYVSLDTAYMSRINYDSVRFGYFWLPEGGDSIERIDIQNTGSNVFVLPTRAPSLEASVRTVVLGRNDNTFLVQTNEGGLQTVFEIAEDLTPDDAGTNIITLSIFRDPTMLDGLRAETRADGDILLVNNHGLSLDLGNGLFTQVDLAILTNIAMPAPITSVEAFNHYLADHAEEIATHLEERQEHFRRIIDNREGDTQTSFIYRFGERLFLPYADAPEITAAREEWLRLVGGGAMTADTSTILAAGLNAITPEHANPNIPFAAESIAALPPFEATQLFMLLKDAQDYNMPISDMAHSANGNSFQALLSTFQVLHDPMIDLRFGLVFDQARRPEEEWRLDVFPISDIQLAQQVLAGQQAIENILFRESLTPEEDLATAQTGIHALQELFRDNRADTGLPFYSALFAADQPIAALQAMGEYFIPSFMSPNPPAGTTPYDPVTIDTVENLLNQHFPLLDYLSTLASYDDSEKVVTPEDIRMIGILQDARQLLDGLMTGTSTSREEDWASLQDDIRDLEAYYYFTYYTPEAAYNEALHQLFNAGPLIVAYDDAPNVRDPSLAGGRGG